MVEMFDRVAEISPGDARAIAPADALAASPAAGTATKAMDSEARKNAEAPMRVGGPVGAPAPIGGLWDKEEFRRRAREIARKAARKRTMAPMRIREDAGQLLPEIMAFKRRSMEILSSRSRLVPETDKVIPDPVSTKNPPFVSEPSETNKIASGRSNLEEIGKQISSSEVTNCADDCSVYSAQSVVDVTSPVRDSGSFVIPYNMPVLGRMQITIPMTEIRQGIPGCLRGFKPVIRKDLEGDRGPHHYITGALCDIHLHTHHQPAPPKHQTRKLEEQRGAMSGKKMMADEGNSSAAENCTPTSKLVGGPSKPPVEKKEMPRYKPRFDPLTLSLAAGAADGIDDDAIAVDFDEVTKNMKSHLIVIGRYLTTQIYSVRNLFVRMKQIWHLRGGMEEKELDDNRFLIRFEHRGDFDHVLKGGPWLYQDFPLLVAEYDGKSSVADVPVNGMKIWVKIMELPLGMMTEDWARKMGNQLGTYKEIPKGGKRNLWDDFFRIRVELDTTKPIKRWVKFQDLKTKEMLRYDVKYERMPTFCYFCGIVGHSDKNCMLPEDDKRVRFCVEQKASPYKDFEHRSYYLPAEPANVKRHLQFLSRSSADWRITGGDESQEYIRERETRRTEEEDSEERTTTANPADVTQMVKAVGNLQVSDGKKGNSNLVITADQVTVAASNILKQKKWTRVYEREQGKTKQGNGRQLKRPPHATLGRKPFSPLKVPPIESCLRSDSSLLQEIRADAARTAAIFSKSQEKLLGKRPGCNDVLMQDPEQSYGGRLGEASDNKLKEGALNTEVQEEGKEDAEQEATSLGAAGTLTGAKERTCQEP